MARKATPSRGKSSSRTGAARKRTPSKPVIIDIEADKAPDSSTTKPSDSPGLDEATARAAGLSAAQKPSQETVETAQTPPTESGAEKESESGPRAFVLAAAGFIGALAALILIFLAQLLGFVSVPNGQLDEQRSALLALEQRVDTRLTAIEAAESTQAVDLGSLEADLAQLRDDLSLLAVEPVSDDAPVDIDLLIMDALLPLEERIGAIEAVIQFPNISTDDPDAPLDDAAGEPTQELEVLAELRDLIDSTSADVFALQTDLEAIQADLETLANADGPQAERLIALDEQFSQLGLDTAARFETLSARVEELSANMAVMGDQLIAFEQAPIAVAPDQLARLGLALEGLAVARDSGTGLENAVIAAQGAAAFDAGLANLLAPLSTVSVDGEIHDAAVLAHYQAVMPLMRAAVPGSTPQTDGFLGALGERARQMVTIRAPGDGDGDVPGTVTGQIDQLGSFIASGQYDGALTAFDALPDAVKAAGGDLHDALNARVTLDHVLTQARADLLAALASSNP